MSEIAELKEQLSLMQQRINELEQEQMAQPVQRRNMLKAVAGVAAGAAVGGLGFARPAAAASTGDGQNITAGNTNQADSSTILRLTSDGTNGGWDANQYSIFGVADNNALVGAKLFTEDAGFGSDQIGDIIESLSHAAITGEAGGSTGDDKVTNGVVGIGEIGILGYGTNLGVYGAGHNYGGQFIGNRAGLFAAPRTNDEEGIGAKLAGEVPLKLYPTSDVELPELATGGHFRFNGDDLYFGTNSGWKNLTNPASPEAPAVTGVFVPVTPFRVYDSRKVTDGRLSKGDNVVVDCSDARAADHSIATADALPAGATAIAYNLTATGTGGAGYLSVAPGDVASTTVSTINWSSANIDIANSSIVKVDANRKVKVFCDGYPGAASDFIIDVVGYYR